MGTITLDNGTQVRKILGFTGLSIKPTLYTDVKGYIPDQRNLYEYFVSPPNYIQGIYKSYQQGNSADQLILWYTVPFQVNGNVLYGDIPINYTISTGTYYILDGDRPATVGSVSLGAIPTTAGSGSDTSDRVYFPNWNVGTQNYQNSVYVMRKPIINCCTLYYVKGTDRQIWAAFFNNNFTDSSGKTTK